MTIAPNRDNFWRRTQAFARVGQVDYRLCEVRFDELCILDLRCVAELRGYPIYWAQHPNSNATVFWPKRPDDVEVVWEYGFDQARYDRFARFYAQSTASRK